MTQTIATIAQALGAQVLGDGTVAVQGLSEPASAGPDDLALAMSPRYGEALKTSDAVAAIVWADADWQALGLKAAIVVPRPRLAMSVLTQMMDKPLIGQGIHPSAIIDPSATIAEGVSIGPFCVVGADAVIGADTTIAEHVSIGAGAMVGARGEIHAGVRIGRNVRIGDRAILHPNVVIGADGFSFVTATPSIAEIGRRTLGKTAFEASDDAIQHRIHSLGSVVLGDHVEVGANATIDAGTIRPTQVGRGTKIDNLVQVGHNVIVGEDCLLCAQTAVAGSAVIGDRSILGGKSGVADNISIGSDCLLGGAAIVLGNTPRGSFMMGYPAKPMLTFRAEQRALRDAAQNGARRNLVSKPSDDT
ncbi:UDP-3-O-(3-hydroxymyristoyl)glucosamine N-acyltransferase [Rhodobacteraceae bacterium S2214]|nr:UDP-3-O-(3-hydroxymyristoyl)glucosamine N-acyltransferase [Rhodobacteraceae bacterium S2214]